MNFLRVVKGFVRQVLMTGQMEESSAPCPLWTILKIKSHSGLVRRLIISPNENMFPFSAFSGSVVVFIGPGWRRDGMHFSRKMFSVNNNCHCWNYLSNDFRWMKISIGPREIKFDPNNIYTNTLVWTNISILLSTLGAFCGVFGLWACVDLGLLRPNSIFDWVTQSARATATANWSELELPFQNNI